MIGIIRSAHIGHHIARFCLFLDQIGLQRIFKIAERRVRIESLYPGQCIGHLGAVLHRNAIARNIATAGKVFDRFHPFRIGNKGLERSDQSRRVAKATATGKGCWFVGLGQVADFVTDRAVLKIPIWRPVILEICHPIGIRNRRCIQFTLAGIVREITSRTEFDGALTITETGTQGYRVVITIVDIIGKIRLDRMTVDFRTIAKSPMRFEIAICRIGEQIVSRAGAKAEGREFAIFIGEIPCRRSRRIAWHAVDQRPAGIGRTNTILGIANVSIGHIAIEIRG